MEKTIEDLDKALSEFHHDVLMGEMGLLTLSKALDGFIQDANASEQDFLIGLQNQMELTTQSFAAARAKVDKFI